MAVQITGTKPNIISRVEMAYASRSTVIRNAWSAIKSGLAV